MAAKKGGDIASFGQEMKKSGEGIGSLFDLSANG